MRKTLKTFLTLLGLVLLLMGALYFFLQSSRGQRLVTTEINKVLKTQFPEAQSHIGQLTYDLPDWIEVKDLYLGFNNSDTLAYLQQARLDVSMIDIVFGKLNIDQVLLNGGTLYISNDNESEVFNYERLLGGTSSTSDTSTSSSSFSIGLGHIAIQNFNAHYRDIKSGIDSKNFLGNLQIEFNAVDLAMSTYDIESVELSDSDLGIILTKGTGTEVESQSKSELPHLVLSHIGLKNFKLHYSDEINGLLSKVNIGTFTTSIEAMDLKQQNISISQSVLKNSVVALDLTEPQKISTKKKGAEPTVGNNWQVQSDDLNIDQVQLKYNQFSGLNNSGEFNPDHFDLSELNFRLRNFSYENNKLKGSIVKLSLDINNKFQLQELSTDFLYGPQQSQLSKLLFRSKNSQFRANLNAKYLSLKEVLNNPLKTALKFNIQPSKLSLSELAYFIPEIKTQIKDLNISDYLQLEGSVTSQNSLLNIQKLALSTLQNSTASLTGSIKMSSALELSRLENLKLAVSSTPGDLYRFKSLTPALSPYQIPESLSFETTLKGSSDSLLVNSQLNSPLGSVDIIGFFTDLLDSTKLAGEGNLKLRNIQVASIDTTLSSIENLTTQGKFSLSRGGQVISAIGSIDSLAFNKYQYTDLDYNLSLKNKQIITHLSSNDVNADFSSKTSVNIADKNLPLSSSIDLKNINLSKLKLSSYNKPLKGLIKIDMSSTDLSRLNGYLSIDSLAIDQVACGNMNLRFSQEHDTQKTNLSSNFIQGNLQGKFTYENLIKSISTLVERNIESSLDSNQYLPTNDLKAQLDLRITPHELWKKILPGLTFTEGIKALAEIKENEAWISLDGKNLRYLENELIGFHSHTSLKNSTTSHLTEFSEGRLGDFTVYNTSIKLDGPLSQMAYHFKSHTSKNDSLANKGRLSLKDDIYGVAIDELILNDIHLTSNKSYIYYKEEQLQTHDFRLSDGVASLAFTAEKDELQLNLENLQIHPFYSFAQIGIDSVYGVLSSNIKIKDPFGDYKIAGNLDLTDITYNELENGEFYTQIGEFNTAGATVNGRLIGLRSYIDFDGKLNLTDKNTLDLNGEISRLDAELLTILSPTYFADAEGVLEGSISAKGPLDNTSISGNLGFYNFNFNTPYLGTDLSIHKQELSIVENEIFFKNFTVKDSLQSDLRVDGYVNFRDYNNIKYDLGIDTESFHFLDAGKGQNELYHGYANLDASLLVKGINDNPAISGNISLNESSKLTFIMPADIETAESEGIVKFINSKVKRPIDSTRNRTPKNRKLDFSNEISVDLFTDPDAIITIIVDPLTGDKLVVQGEANLTAGTDSNGDIVLVGNYEVRKGLYEFSFEILKRSFKLAPGGTLSWSGDPYTASLNLTAFYEVKTDIQSLNAFGLSVDRYGTVPLDVLLNIRGTVEKPQVSFDIRTSEKAENSLKSLIESRDIFADLKQNPTEMNQQAFSLLVLGKFSNQQATSPNLASTGEALARRSVSKILSAQLNSFTDKLLGNSGLNLGLSSDQIQGSAGSAYKTDLNIGFNKSLFNDRVKVSAGKNFELENTTEVSQNSTQLLDNVEIAYYLTPDGKYIVKAYRDNEFQTILEGFILETGLSFIITSEYNKFIELFKK